MYSAIQSSDYMTLRVLLSFGIQERTTSAKDSGKTYTEIGTCIIGLNGKRKRQRTSTDKSGVRVWLVCVHMDVG